MTLTAREIETFISRTRDAAVVRITGTEGSTPRETGALMLVSAETAAGTVGGGQLEFIAIGKARTMLRDGQNRLELDIPLGPDIGQCCGGRVMLMVERLTHPAAQKLIRESRKREAAQPQIYIFGAGHVGRALAVALAPLPFNTTIVDTRPETLEGLPGTVIAKAAALPEAVVRAAAPGSAFVVMTHDHALDFLITREVLLRRDAAFAGMIGSKSKKAQFRHWFLGEGGGESDLAQLVMPIGAQGPGDKRPEIIAALVVAEIIGKIGQKDCPTPEIGARLTSGTGDR